MESASDPILSKRVTSDPSDIEGDREESQVELIEADQDSWHLWGAMSGVPLSFRKGRAWCKHIWY